MYLILNGRYYQQFKLLSGESQLPQLYLQNRTEISENVLFIGMNLYLKELLHIYAMTL